MYYKEEWIGRELYWKSSPNGSWVPFTKEQYRERCLRLEAELKKIESTNKPK